MGKTTAKIVVLQFLTVTLMSDKGFCLESLCLCRLMRLMVWLFFFSFCSQIKSPMNIRWFLSSSPKVDVIMTEASRQHL